ncbi:MAG: PAS domain-containing protein [Myxococcales bacterium]|nr:PAS domain-containing protein [Myxococcales bacterium]
MTSDVHVAELQARLELLATSFQRSPLYLTVTDLSNDRYLEVNDTFCQAIGFTREEMIGRNAVELGLITPDGRDRLARELMAMAAAAQRYPLEFEIRRKDGTALVCRYWGEVVQTAAGMRLIAAAENVTEFRNERLARESALAKQDAALRRSDERFALAMDAISDGLWDWDLASDTSYFSPGYYRMLGLPLGGLETSGLGWLARVHADDRPSLETAIRECSAGLRPHFEGEYRLQATSGEWLWVLGRGRPLGRDAQGRALRVLATQVDITERKRLQLGLAQNDRLVSLGMLSAGVAHEINNPLASVTANLELLLAQVTRLPGLPSAAAADLADLARNALDGTQRVKKISRALSTFSRVEPVVLQAVDVNHALEEAARMANAELRYRATLVSQTGTVPPAKACPGTLVQVFLNLIVNAAHAVDDGKADHRITLRSWAADGGVFVEVQDTGAGIPSEHLPRVFEPFFTTKPAGMGSGLGLAVSKRLLDECGGDIRIESVVGQGTRVTVRLDEHRAASVTPEVPLEPAAVKAPVRRRMLVIDDEPLLRRALARQLAEHHDVVAAASGLEALAQIAAHPDFDAILCDLMMPEMSGMDFHARLVTQQPALARRVIFMSGGAFTASAEDYLRSVDNPRVEKPFKVSRVLAMVDEVASLR